jgi:hypothetical protein
MANQQVLVWTALPTGISGNTLSLSVFLSPQLTGALTPPATFVPLSDFGDFVDWPTTIAGAAPISFSVGFAALGAIAPTATEAATIVTPAPPVTPSTAWTKLFAANTTSVESFALPSFLIDPSTHTTLTPAINSFWAAQLAGFVSSLYGSIGASNPVDPPIITWGDRAGTPSALQTLLTDLINPDDLYPFAKANPDVITTTQQQALSDLQTFHNLPAAYGGYDPNFTPTTPTLDFHQGLSALATYPVLLRLLGLVFDLTVALPTGLPQAIQLLVTPTWSHAPSSAPAVTTLNFTPWTAATLTSTIFQATPSGTEYSNGTLVLGGNTAFSVTDLDVEIAADRLGSLSAALVSTGAFKTTPSNPNPDDRVYDNAQTALTVPALRSIGPTLLWSGYGKPLPGGPSQSPFAALLAGQASIQQALTAWIASPTPANLPTLHAEQVTRGHRFDIYTASEATPAWRGLCGRVGTYTFGPNSSSPPTFTVADEGIVTPAASQLAGTVKPPPPALNVLETIVRWRGWGLCAPRPGNWVADDSNDIEADPATSTAPPAPTADGPNLPQLATSFVAPDPTSALNLLFPKLRFGNRYRLRARAVDLAGNSLPLSSSYSGTSIAFTHYRHEPVRPPMLAGMNAFTAGESTLYLVLLDYQLEGVTPTTNGRWLFPPRVSELMAEEHGMFDGTESPSNPADGTGSPPNLADGPNPNIYPTIAYYDGKNLGDVPGAQYDAGNQNVPYFTGSTLPVTPWLPDPLSSGVTLFGLPGLTEALTTGEWGGVWPVANPILLTLSDGTTATSQNVAAGSGTPATVATTLPRGEVAVVRVSSTLSASALQALGVWQWIAEQPGLASDVPGFAQAGQVWLLSPFQVLRMVHAVRVPLLPPGFGSPQTTRFPGQNSVLISDPEFNVDEKSTGHVDVAAVWTDPYDNPSDSNSDPVVPVGVPPQTPAQIPSTPIEPTSFITSAGPAFRLAIPDPTPTGPEAQPLTVLAEATKFALGAHGDGATHAIGDTLHHLVYYSATGSSRFADLFETTETATLTNASPSVVISTADLGVNEDTLTVTIVGGQQLTTDEYTYDAATRTVTVSTSSTLQVAISYQPTTTLVGEPHAVEILSSARPKAPVISDVVPAWRLAEPAGSLSGSGLEVARTGGFLRVYLERPWFSTGAGELLGVVTTVPSKGDATTIPRAWVTVMGLDPINYVEQSNTPWPIVPTLFTELAPVPIVPGRPPYTNPPQAYLPEDAANLYQVWPYEVNYDTVSGRWYADIAPRPGVTEEGVYEPPPGYFIRLALVRFQPYSELYEESTGYQPGSTIEVSPVVTATIAQPVPDRTVVVVADGIELKVTVSGPAYQGWRAVQGPWFGDPTDEQFDLNNEYAPPNPNIYEGTQGPYGGTLHTSTIAVEVQVQNEALNKLGLSDDLAWMNSGGGTPVIVTLTPTFSDATTSVTWTGTIALPDSLSSSTLMRLRVSEIDYYEGSGPPSSVDTSLRRPFVSLIPLNYTA